MRTFETYLQRSVRKDDSHDWSLHYIDYALLKQKIRYFLERRRAWRNRGEIEYSTDLMISENDYFSHEVSPEVAQQRLASSEREEFVLSVNQELLKCATFAEVQFEKLSVALKGLEAQTDTIEDVAAETLETFHFIVTNICTLRQIITRYNSFRRTVEATLVAESDIPLARKLFELKPLTRVQAAISLYNRSRNMHEDATQFSQQCAQFRLILDSSLQSVERGGGGNNVVKDRVLSSSRQFLIKGSSKMRLMLEPSFQAGRHLKQEMRTLAKWRDTKILASRPSHLDPSNVWPLVLNLMSCLLFIMNNYIIQPSSAYYANALGTSDALSGIMIGASAWFALFSTIGYSFWTNTSYKQPIMFAGTLMMIGNFIYSNAYSYSSIHMCLIGRAICGLGAPRVIHRRYVADATPFALRTMSCAAFALMTGIGAALGPGMAILLDLLNFEFTLPILGKQYFNGMTGPGYFMSLAWSIYTLLVIMTFREPNRSGLEELRRREEDFETLWNEDVNEDEDDESLDTEHLNEAGNKEEESPPIKPSFCLKHMTKAAVLCMSITFMKRIALESIVGSTSAVAKNRYLWTITNVGTLHLVNGVIVIPISITIGWVSQFFEDRFMAMWLLGMSIVGMLVLVDVTDLMDHSNDTFNADQWLSVGPGRYIAGSLIAFSGLEASESFVASLMSKVVPSALAAGTLNSGLLATLVGTSGRATGDLLITAMGLISIRNLLNLVVIPGIVFMVISFLLVRQNYSILGV